MLDAWTADPETDINTVGARTESIHEVREDRKGVRTRCGTKGPDRFICVQG